MRWGEVGEVVEPWSDGAVERSLVARWGDAVAGFTVAFDERVDLTVGHVEADGTKGRLELAGGHVAVRVDVLREEG